jgi:dTDP-4-dehydrorhamnose 3,5-epimerase-like enzyme
MSENNISVSTPLDACGIIKLPQINSGLGNLIFAETVRHVQFDIQRAYIITDVPDGAVRGGHAHKSLWQLLICAHGSCKVSLSDGLKTVDYFLSEPTHGLLVGPAVWRDLTFMSEHKAVLVVLASDHYDEKDYIRSYEEFSAWSALNGS